MGGGIEPIANDGIHSAFFLSSLSFAANQGQYTIQAFKAMASGEQVDIQRATRWPGSNATGTVKIRDDDDSDWSDEDV